MRIILIVCLTTICVISGQVAAAQVGNGTLVHLDKPYYTTGETVYYKIYLPTVFRNRAPMFEMRLYNGEGDLVDKSYLKKGGNDYIYGHYRIPYEADSDLYQLVAVSLVEMTGQTLHVAKAPVPVFSDRESELVVSEVNNIQTASNSKMSGLSISIRIQKQQYRPREEVKLEIAIHDPLGNPVKANISISVTDIGIIGSQESHSYTTLHQTDVLLESSSHLSEYIPVSGRLQSQKDGQLLTFFIPSLNKIYYTTSVSKGNFQLLIPGFYGERALQYIGEFSGETRLDINPTSPIQTTKRLVYSSVVGKYLKESRNRKLIYQLFNKVESRYEYGVPESVAVSNPDREFEASNYPFEDITRFCKELSTPLKYVNDKNRGFEYKMFNPEIRDFFFGTPLFIVDGQMTKDAAYLSSLDFQKIDRISLYYDNLRLANDFGFAGFSGVVMIKSKEGNFKIPQQSSTQEFQVNGLQPLISKNKESNITQSGEPVFKPRLLWEPSQDTKDDGSLELSYVQSDDISECQIEIVAQSSDGKRGYGRLVYQVR